MKQRRCQERPIAWKITMQPFLTLTDGSCTRKDVMKRPGFGSKSRYNILNPQVQMCLEHYGDVMYKLGKKEEALRYWKKAREAGEGSKYLKQKIDDKTLYE
jgi:hypothetical protein